MTTYTELKSVKKKITGPKIKQLGGNPRTKSMINEVKTSTDELNRRKVGQ